MGCWIKFIKEIEKQNKEYQRYNQTNLNISSIFLFVIGHKIINEGTGLCARPIK
jgi:hypothetical protein